MNTKPEIIIRSLLHRLGYRFRLHRKDLPGNPDIVLPKYKAIIFVNGCFWHHHEGCPEGKIPKSNLGYWEPKLLRNSRRDSEGISALEQSGWRVLVIWECEIRKHLEDISLRLLDFLGTNPN